MSYFRALTFTLLAILPFIIGAEESAPTIKFHPIQVLLEQVDKRQWKLAYEGDAGSMITKWFIHTNEDTDHASEIFTFHYIPSAEKVSCEEYCHNFMASVRLANNNTSVHSEVIHTTGESMFWQWKLQAKGEEQLELVFVKKYGKSLLVYRYTTKKMDERDLKIWRDFISLKLEKNRFLFESTGYRLWLPNMWQISEIISASSNENVEFFAPCDYSITMCVKPQPKLDVSDDSTIMKNLFHVGKYESKETLLLNNKSKATLYTFETDPKTASKKLIAKIERDQKTTYLYAGMTLDNFSKNKEEYLAILKSFELL